MFAEMLLFCLRFSFDRVSRMCPAPHPFSCIFVRLGYLFDTECDILTVYPIIKGRYSMKKLSRFLLSRTFLFGVLIACQLGIFVWLMLMFRRAGTVAYIILTLISALVIIAVVEHNNINPAYKIMWLLIVVVMPVTGPICYLWWGRHGIPPKRARQLVQMEKDAACAFQQEPAVTQALYQEFPDFRHSVEYLRNYAAAPVYSGTQTEYYSMGQEFLAPFLDALRKAEKYIFLEYFIVEEGQMWDPILAILREKAAAGVDVRVIYDGFGSMFTLPADYDEQLCRMGIQCHAFNPLHFSLHISDYKLFNHRDHRKIAVIDGCVGFTGGLNFADEYINRKLRCGVWKDTAVKLEGSAVYSLTVSFLTMWDYVAGTKSDYEAYRCPCAVPAQGYVQPYFDSPLNNEIICENAYINIIRRAQRYVYITTPYLIIDNELMSALCLAAKSGVDVRILTPGIPDKAFVYQVTQSYYPRLLEAGVHIYEYTPGFMHAKMFVSDDREAIVGTANLDFRSLYLHFENCCAFYGGSIVQSVLSDINRTLAECHEVTLEETHHIPLYKVLTRIFMRFFAPLL